jgi:hypothetical protein
VNRPWSIHNAKCNVIYAVFCSHLKILQVASRRATCPSIPRLATDCLLSLAKGTASLTGWDLWCDPVGGGGNLPRGLGLRSRGRKAPPREAVGRAGGGCREGGRPLPPRGSGGITPGKFLRFYMQNPAFRGTFRLTN